MPERGRLLLFDVDGTLVSYTPVHRDSFLHAFRKVYGVDTGIEVIDSDGLSDQMIIMEVLKRNGLPEERIRAGLEECMNEMSDYYTRNSRKHHVAALEGVPGLLEEMRRRGFVTGLVTGNLEPIARSKMRDAGLDRYFRIGGFGSDGPDRAGLVMLAVKRAGEETGLAFSGKVFLFGDTPRDIEAGRKAGVVPVGVATGNYSVKALRASGAGHVIRDFRDIGEVLGIVS